ncbi:MAG: hypothetical protein EOP04_00510 [Proteobacteria bacterium]|nr:MAG: hypothetical protein EOP04_00510 [Pseudomonadota bacterium]
MNHNQKRPFKKGILEVVLQWISTKEKPQKVPEELQNAIDRCRSIEELKSLLFSMKGMGESVLRAFDKRIDELERAA